MAGLLMRRVVSSCDRCRCWNTPSGRLAALNASAKRSAQSGVCAECLRMTVLPAASAGMTALTAVRYG
jgi:hypothetical protein